MEQTVRHVRVVLVSPGDVPKERAAMQAVIDELNRTIASDRGLILSLWRWETDAHPGLHLDGPQGLIDELMDIGGADLVIAVFWKRFGTPAFDADSGTEHELRRAWQAWRERGCPQVMVYFATRPHTPNIPDDREQWERLQAFRSRLPEECLWWTYGKPTEFERLVREHVSRYLFTLDGSAGSRGLRFNLPPVAAAFTGRERELDQLHEALTGKKRAVITQAITGLGGVGKSQLAARYVQERANEYEVVAWIRAEDGGIADLAALAARLGVAVGGLPPSDRARLALERLGMTERRWLLVLDNVESAEQLNEMLPKSGNGQVLVTSRDRGLRQFGPTLAVDVFDEDTATGYLIERAGRLGDTTAGRELARALGCLPLALAHAAAYCESGTKFSDYQHRLDELPAPDLFTSHPELGYAQTVASTWKTSIRAASLAAPLAGQLLEFAAYLAPDGMPKPLFHWGDDGRTAAAEHRVTLALNALARLSLAAVDDDTVSMHRLLQKTVRDDAAARGDSSAARRAISVVHDAFPYDARLPVDWPLSERLLPHVLALANTAPRQGHIGAPLVSLTNRACEYLNRAKAGPRGLSFALFALELSRQLLDPEHPEALTARDRLATAYFWAGRNDDAITIHEPLLVDRERILGREHPDTLTTQHNLAIAWHEAGNVMTAITIDEPLLAKRERVLGAHHPDTLRTRHNLARAYHHVGRTERAITMYEALMADRDRVLGAEHPDALRTRNNLARAYQDAEQIDEAIAMYKLLITDSERILGPEHPATLTTRNSLGTAYQDAGLTSLAIEIYEPLLLARETILGIEHPSTRTTQTNLAIAYHSAGRRAEAKQLRERVGSPDDPFFPRLEASRGD